MIWVCRAGEASKHYEYYVNHSIISMPWDGYKQDLSCKKELSEFKDLVIAEKGDVARTSVSNWASQLYSFCIEMKKDDYVVIPGFHSKSYTLCRIEGEYEFDEDQPELYHTRKIKVLVENAPREIFPQSIQYSLGAFRTVFKPKEEEVILKIFKQWKKEK